MGVFDKIFGSYSQRELKKIEPIVKKVLDLEEKYQSMSDISLKACTKEFKERLNNGETVDDILPEAFAVCREAAWRVLGMKHFPVQIIGGIVLHQGRIAEMRTGEGKTLVATLPSYLNGLTGLGVHVVTVNDYLAKYQSEWMGKLYRFLGLTVGLVISDMEPDQKRIAYAADITYGTNNEYGFDYLRDNMAVKKEELVQRPHHYAIVDEVDSILIDEARTPLIISQPGEKSTDLYRIADNFAKSLKYVKVKETDDKEFDDDVDADYMVDEKGKRATLTEKGVEKAEKYFNIENLTDPENSTVAHHINQAIRANSIMQKDIDYVIKDMGKGDEIVIVDEFTGRMMIGRRYNEGLHQAIEAKERVEIQKESKTVATITFQNYFRMYKKLSGMTGTAMTEEREFRDIYSLDVVEIPTNKPIKRTDNQDSVYKTESAKYNAVCEQVIECHKKGQPVLVGTTSIEKSELLSGMLKRKGIKHEVLNAKYHEKEAEIVAQAGKFGAVTIATNMAGRGTDIMLGGNAEFLARAQMRKLGMSDILIEDATSYADTDDQEIIQARKKFRELNDKYKEEIKISSEKVCSAGGLFIVGTERHESRRIDNQLRGRAGRQGDPGETRFYLSLQDDLMRLFGGERMENMMGKLNVEEDLPIEAKILSGSIESAQKKVEGRNYAIRKNVLEYDDVMNKQREIIYGQRGRVLNGESIFDVIKKMIGDNVDAKIALYLTDPDDAEDAKENWDLNGLRDYYRGWVISEKDLHFTPEELKTQTKDMIATFLKDRMAAIHQAIEETIQSEQMRELERFVLLRNVDSKWIDHIDAMEELKRGIYLRSYGQKNPVVEYTHEGFEMFDEMITSICEDTVKMILTIRINNHNQLVMMPIEQPIKREMIASHGDDTESAPKKPVHVEDKIGRNELCPCGSGKKYKKCCGKDK